MVRLYDGEPLPEFITNLTGIKPEDLDGGMDEVTALYLLGNFIEDSTVVAQNAPFDLSFLSNAVVYPEKFICTRALTRLVEPDESPSLKATCERHGINLEGQHRAENDVLATIEVFKVMRRKADESGIEYHNVVINTPDRPLTFIPKYAKVIEGKDGVALSQD